MSFIRSVLSLSTQAHRAPNLARFEITRWRRWRQSAVKVALCRHLVENEKKAAVCEQSKRVSDNVNLHSSSGVCFEKVVVNLIYGAREQSLLLDRKCTVEKARISRLTISACGGLKN